MSGIKGQPRADHRLAAQQARQMPGEWVLAATYNSRSSATSQANQVRTAERLPAYRPARSFQARVELTQDGADLYVRCVDRDALASRECAESVACGLMESVDVFCRRLDAADTTRRTT